MYQRGRRLVGLMTALALLPGAAWAHALGDEANEALARGLNMSILFLLSMPVAIVGAIFVTVYLTQKRGQSHVHQENETRSPVAHTCATTAHATLQHLVAPEARAYSREFRQRGKGAR